MSCFISFKSSVWNHWDTSFSFEVKTLASFFIQGEVSFMAFKNYICQWVLSHFNCKSASLNKINCTVSLVYEQILKKNVSLSSFFVFFDDHRKQYQPKAFCQGLWKRHFRRLLKESAKSCGLLVGDWKGRMTWLRPRLRCEGRPRKTAMVGLPWVVETVAVIGDNVTISPCLSATTTWRWPKAFENTSLWNWIF